MATLVWTLPFLFLAELLGRTSSTLHLEKASARLFVVRVVIGIGLNLILIPRYGVMGAAISAVVTAVVRIVLDTILIGPATLWQGNVGSLLRVASAGAVMGGVVLLLRRAAFLTRVSDATALSLLVSSGAVVYAASALLLGAVSPGEVRYVCEIARRRLKRIRGLG
jgi:peptidoglycan biosynthesis protein MviN/MurJ (putative lipid II flippase)